MSSAYLNQIHRSSCNSVLLLTYGELGHLFPIPFEPCLSKFNPKLKRLPLFISLLASYFIRSYRKVPISSSATLFFAVSRKCYQTSLLYLCGIIYSSIKLMVFYIYEQFNFYTIRIHYKVALMSWNFSMSIFH